MAEQQKKNTGTSSEDRGEKQPHVGTDPMRAPQNAEERKVVAPDPEKVKRAQRSD